MTSLDKKLHETGELNQEYKPAFYRLSHNEDKKKFEQLLSLPGIQVFDQIENQLKELIKSQNPGKQITEEGYQTLIQQKYDGKPGTEYGIWVYYSWSGRIVHILDEAEFIDLRTSANRQKITTAERDLLATKKVGVIGLSVGQSVSMTLAMERGCGELRLADFDTLELNNLNRIRTGLHNLGIFKAWSVAREIAELDPFFKVVIYTEGIKDHTIDDFFTKGGTLDLVIDECDSVDIKILCRLKAKDLQIPVLMEASDRGTLDVERFDLEPKRPVIHGWLKNLPIDIKTLKELKTPAEKLAYMLPIAGLDTLSARMRASLIEMQSTITTWPQLASAVTLGGALTADTARRIFLNQFTDSGRYFIDLESLVRDVKPIREYTPPENAPLLDLQEMKNMAYMALNIIKPATFIPEVPMINTLVQAATKAPSDLNCQPWKWLYLKGYLFLFAENEEQIPYEDHNKFGTYLANGAALENLELEASAHGVGTNITYFPLLKNRVLVAAIQFTKNAARIKANDITNGLARFIDFRVTNRTSGNNEPIDAEVYKELHHSVTSIPGAKLFIKNSADDLEKLAILLGAAERIRLLNPAAHHAIFNQIRWSNDEFTRTGTGIHIDALALSQPELLMMKMIRRPEVIGLLADWKGGKALEFSTRRNVLSSSAIGVITMPDHAHNNCVMAGRALQRMWLTATKNNIAVQPIQSAITHFTSMNGGQSKDIPSYLRDEIKEQSHAFAKVFREAGSNQPVFLVRLSISSQPELKTFRKQLEKVLFIPGTRS